MQRIVLASQSARRREILERLGLKFEVVESKFDEKSIECEEPEELVEELALAKALEVARGESDAIVVGGDTVVAINGEILGKGKNEHEARVILKKLIGKRHKVVTGVAVVNSLTGETAVGHETAEVVFREVAEVELEKYLQDGLYRGFAGCYAIQGGAESWVIEQRGVFSAVIGMPVLLTVELLEQMGVWVESDPIEIEQEIQNEKVGITQEGMDR